MHRGGAECRLPAQHQGGVRRDHRKLTLAVFSKKRYKEIFLPVVISGKLENENIKLLGLSKNYILKRLNEKKLKLKDIAFYSLSEINEGSLFLFK